MSHPLRSLWPAGAALSFALLLSGCEEIVYKNKEMFNPPPDSVSGFLGYFNAATQQTTCGNCHAEKQAGWAATKHHDAWKDLQASGHAQESCNPCHTTNESGNIVTVAAGFNQVQDSAYHDVQCESCHGPGVNHLGGPETWQPLASIAVDTAATKTNGCGECHTGTHNPFVEEWSQSHHGYGGHTWQTYYNRDPCKNCHESREALRVNFAGFDPRPSGQAGGPVGVYLEATISGAAGAQPVAVCAVCHDPHDATNEGQLRAPVGEPELEQVCVHCHRREGAPEVGHYSFRGPHGAQGLIWTDEDLGWKPSNWPYTERLLPSHSSANPRGCAACHVTPFTINDASGKFVKNYTGHLFEAIPCIDQSTGQPIPEGSCTEDQRYFGGCAVSGCHGSAAAARTAYEVLEGRLNYLTDQLWADTDTDSVMETTDGGLLPKVLAQAIAANNLDVMNRYDTTLTPADGAIWNAQLAATDERPFWFRFKIKGQNSCNPTSTSASDKCPGTMRVNTGHRSSGGGVHNPFLLEALLTETIKAIQTTYGVTASQPLDLAVHAKAPPGLRTASR